MGSVLKYEETEKDWWQGGSRTQNPSISRRDCGSYKSLWCRGGGGGGRGWTP